MSTESIYIHGSSLEEQHRLSLMNDLLNEASLRELELQGGERILDLGCGTGQFARAMARAAGQGGTVVGIERDDPQRAEATRLAVEADEAGFVEFRAGDATQLDLPSEEWGAFDVVHARFLLEHIPNPELVVQHMLRAAKPGGRIVLADDDHENFRPWPEPSGFNVIWEAFVDSFVAAGNDPFVGRRLVHLLHNAGVVETRNTSIFFGGCKGNDLFHWVADNLIYVIQGAREAMIGQGLIDIDSFETGIDGLRRWKEHPSATLWYYVCWAEGVAPSG